MFFDYPPSPPVLQWLSEGQLANRIQRSFRLWVLLTQLYSVETNWKSHLPKSFSYPDLRQYLYAPGHPQSDRLASIALLNCDDQNCICHRRMQDWLDDYQSLQSQREWQQQIRQMTGFTEETLAQHLQEAPFRTVHHSVRDDLKRLMQMGWLKLAGKGRYECVPFKDWPCLPESGNESQGLGEQLRPHAQKLLWILDAIAFAQPALAEIIDGLQQFVWQHQGRSNQLAQRIFFHVEYILSDEVHEQVDVYQNQLEEIWETERDCAVQFQYWVEADELVEVVVYPVCLHYIRRAKYLSGFGRDPYGKVGWHNYRLDRIAASELTVVDLSAAEVPPELKKRHQEGNLPQPDEVREALEFVWGFNFYLPRKLLILRFTTSFARWYVENTIRHDTFKPVPYKQLPGLIRKEIRDLEERDYLMRLLQERSPQDCYYRAWIREGDINLIMRLRDWRPNGEVIAPLSLRRLMLKEIREEMQNYREEIQEG